MKTPPFKLKGVYVMKVDPKEIVNYRPTRLGNIWKASIGEKEESHYSIIHFSPKETVLDIKDAKSFCVSITFRQGEIFNLVDDFKNRSSIYADFENVVFSESHFEFGDERRKYTGVIAEDILFLQGIDVKVGGGDWEEYRYIPWKH